MLNPFQNAFKIEQLEICLYDIISRFEINDKMGNWACSLKQMPAKCMFLPTFLPAGHAQFEL